MVWVKLVSRTQLFEGMSNALGIYDEIVQFTRIRMETH
jgi:hypothetical protein